MYRGEWYNDAEDDGWTLVRRGRRREGAPHRQGGIPIKERNGDYRGVPGGSRGGGRNRWMARATPAGRRENDNLTYQPVPPVRRGPPPPGFYPGQQKNNNNFWIKHSYAEAVRGFNRPQNPVRKHTRTQYEIKQDKRGSTYPKKQKQKQSGQTDNPEFTFLTRKIHTIIKVAHHLQNVASYPAKKEPKMIARMIEVLSTMIRPAAPSPCTQDFIVGNAKQWGHSTMIILQEHYQNTLDTLLGEIATLLTPSWRDCFLVASRWARRNLPRLSQGVLDQVEALLTGQLDSRGSPEHPQHLQQTTEHTTQTVQTQTNAQPGGNISRGMETHKTTVSTMTEWPTRENDEGDAPTQTENDLITLEELPQEEIDLPAHSHDLPSQENCIAVQENPSEGSPTLTDLCNAFEEDALRNALPKRVRGQKRTEKVQKLVFDELPPSSGQKRSLQDQEVENWLRECAGPNRDVNFTSEQTPAIPAAQYYGVTDHGSTQEKTRDWGLTVTENTILMGDSNLRKIGNHVIPGLQIDSFPGAGFQHAEDILSKIAVQSDVEEVILSFGINNRSLRWKDATSTHIRGTLEKAKLKFPNARVFIPLLNFSNQLPSHEITVLGKLNDYIRENGNFIPPLQTDDFETGPDNIHWTYETATNMLHHWIEYLNAQGP